MAERAWTVDKLRERPHDFKDALELVIELQAEIFGLKAEITEALSLSETKERCPDSYLGAHPNSYLENALSRIRRLEGEDM